MYIHIGEDASIKLKEIVAIIDGNSSSELVEEFLRHQEGSIMNLAKKSYKSIVVTDNHVYLSPFASKTLKKRSNFMNIQDLR